MSRNPSSCDAYTYYIHISCMCNASFTPACAGIFLAGLDQLLDQIFCTQIRILSFQICECSFCTIVQKIIDLPTLEQSHLYETCRGILSNCTCWISDTRGQIRQNILSVRILQQKPKDTTMHLCR